ncbi:ABC transporter ATP-binding protein [Sporolactobacillus shoreae]|uniref:ABC transporter ATP-binding protein n=1 Tax=Sporolactobacillus shoreae TaxID=1465501 RepID=A0A4Z0GP18_9BACL|nr:ABC transporter ATP-binding protein [Sporolactobacillus shoreae]TGA97654.1 ABC transporter ATP-binding protein [Sporolactobacillus shoreae]
MIIDASRISWRRENKEVLKDVTWQVRKGEHWSLVGLNGSGKTTLLKMINGYIWPTSGTLSVLDQPFGKVDLRELRKQIGWVSSALAGRLRPQENPESIVLSGKFASIGLYDALTDDDRSKAKELLALLHCSSFSDRPFGTLSEGEKQRVLIARALMASPELLILDEPCNGLDIFARERLLSMVQQLAFSSDAPTMIFVTHHVGEILPCFDHTLLLKAGTVYQSGLTSRIMTPENMTAFYGDGVIVEQHGDRLSIAIRS